jgi:hypothetical protein
MVIALVRYIVKNTYIIMAYAPFLFFFLVWLDLTKQYPNFLTNINNIL